MRKYVYFFTRQDISPEQQIVQTAHVALKLGNSTLFKDDPDNTYFTVVGVRNLDGINAVIKILTNFGFEFEAFVEPDIGDQITSIATYPIPEDKRDVLMAFNLLKV